MFDESGSLPTEILSIFNSPAVAEVHATRQAGGAVRGPRGSVSNPLRPSSDTTIRRSSQSVHALAAIHLITTVEFGSSFTSRRKTSGRA